MTSAEHDALVARLRHRAMTAKSRVMRLYWKRALARARARTPVTGLSDRGAEFIARFEGFRSHVYRDPVGVWTIGYGSTKHVGPNTPPVTEQKARERLRREVNTEYAPAVLAAARRAGKQLTQSEADALISAVYNLGPGVLSRGRSLGDALYAPRAVWRGRVAEALRLYDKAGGRALPGLTKRRWAERRLFLNRYYGGKP